MFDILRRKFRFLLSLRILFLTVIFLLLTYLIYVFVSANVTNHFGMFHMTYAKDVRSRVIVFGSRFNCETCILVFWEVFSDYSTTGSKLRKARIACVYLADHNSRGTSYWCKSELRDLQINSSYCYYVFNENPLIKSPQIQFSVPLPRSKLIFFGDMGVMSTGLPAVVSLINQSATFDAVFHLGDIGYDLWRNEGLTGDKFLTLIEPLASRVPYLTVPGDHELVSHFYHYRHRFWTPGGYWPGKENYLWFSMDIGKFHLIAFNSETLFWSRSHVEAELLWLLRDLQAASQRRHVIPWIVVGGHKPLYCSQLFPQDCNSPHSILREAVEELFHVFKVDVYLSGHCHSYERFMPVYKGEVLGNYENPLAVVPIVIGTMGNNHVTDKINSSRHSASRKLISELPTEVYGELQACDQKLIWKAINTSDLTIVDSIEIMKSDKTLGNISLFINGFPCKIKKLSQKLLTNLPPPISIVRIELTRNLVCSIILICCVIIVFTMTFKLKLKELLFS